MRLDCPLRLQNPQMHYAWGAKSELKRLFSIPCDKDKPQAELWMGAHYKAPSKVVQASGKTQALDYLISQSSIELTGNDTGKLPFLFKLLSADKPLSIQVHPNKSQANKGYNRENKKGISQEEDKRNYCDNNHKPELIYAVTPFKAMCGFRPIAEIRKHLKLLIHEGIKIPHFLYNSQLTPETLRIIFVWMLSMTTEEKSCLIGQLVKIARRNTGVLAFDTLLELYHHYPEDSAIIAPFWLNLVDLMPGSAMFLNAGCPHAYLHGTGIEVMASSDNVLRGGLTSKHIDVSELCNITRFAFDNVSSIVKPKTIYDGELILFPVPVEDFSFLLLNVKTRWCRKGGIAHIAFCMEGNVTLESNGVKEILTIGESCFLPAVCSVDITGRGKLALASSGKVPSINLFHRDQSVANILTHSNCT